METIQAEQSLTAAKRAIRSGKPRLARQHLKRLLQHDSENVTAWLMLTGTASSADAARRYIARAELLQPDHPALPKMKRFVQKKADDAALPHSVQAQKRPFSAAWTVWAVRGGLLLLMVTLLAATGWFVWQQMQSPAQPIAQPAAVQNQPLSAADLATSTPQPVAAYALSETAVLSPTPSPVKLAAKNIVQRTEVRATWTVTPIPSPTPLPTPTALPTFVNPEYSSGQRPFGTSSNERWIDVNLTSQSLTAYEGDTAVFSALVSSGTWEFPTVTGQFRIWLRFENQTMNGELLGFDYYLEDVPYVMYFFEDYAIHGAYWHSNFGNPMSHGCVNVHPTDAEWLYSWATLGTLVNVHY